MACLVPLALPQVFARTALSHAAPRAVPLSKRGSTPSDLAGTNGDVAGAALSAHAASPRQAERGAASADSMDFADLGAAAEWPEPTAGCQVCGWFATFAKESEASGSSFSQLFLNSTDKAHKGGYAPVMARISPKTRTKLCKVRRCIHAHVQACACVAGELHLPRGTPGGASDCCDFSCACGVAAP